MINPAPHWIWREAAVGNILYLEQRARTWIIKLSCELITPSKRPGRFQEARNRLRKMTLISLFFFANGIYFFSSKRMVLDQVETVSHLDWIISGSSQPDVIAVLCLTGTMDSGKISHQFRQSDFHSHVDQIWCFYCCSWQWECMASCYDHRLDNSSQHNEEL